MKLRTASASALRRNNWDCHPDGVMMSVSAVAPTVARRRQAWWKCPLWLRQISLAPHLAEVCDVTILVPAGLNGLGNWRMVSKNSRLWARWLLSWGVSLLFIVMRAPLAIAQTPPEVRIVDFGEYVVDHETGTIDPKFIIKTLNPVRTSVAPTFISHASRIEIRPCRRFGISFEAHSTNPDEADRLTIRVTHPMMVRPDGASGEVETWQSPTDLEGSFAGFSFSYAWEMVPGTWTFSLLFADQVLAEQKFELIESSGTPTMPHGGCSEVISSIGLPSLQRLL
jgi:hypothetical protein